MNEEEISMPGIFEPKVVTEEGPVLGVMDGDIYVFKGIPYAKPPVGDLRWRPPKEVQHWTEPLQAQERGDSCFQNAILCAAIGGGDPTPMSEDCLYLNVWTPRLQATEPLPVMVWIHGGGYVIGAGDLPPYMGTPLAKRSAVVVNINYRLGHLGFFAHPALEEEAKKEGKEIVYNFALLDQIAALEWVQRNIAHFGGDPGNVTIFGQSAGGRSVLSLFASPLVTERETKLFHKGVAQSVYGLPDVTGPKALRRGEHFATYFKIHESRPADILAKLRQLDASEFWAIRPNPKFEGEAEAAFGWPVPISGDSVLPKPMLDVFEDGEQAKLPLIIGNNSDDSSVLADFGLQPSYIIGILKDTPNPKAPPPTLYGAVKLLYPLGIDDDELGRQIGRDLLFTTMSFVIVKSHERAGAASWRYYFDYVAEKQRPEFPKGARHGDEVSYVLDTLRVAPPLNGYSEQDEAFAQKVSHYWLEFARSASNESVSIAGDPKPWPKHEPASLQPPKQNQTMGFGGFGRATSKSCK
jgi:para-nitrobenzyl esterase